MRLLNAQTLQLTEFKHRDPPKYAIVSHRWEDNEIVFEDFDRRAFDVSSASYYKLTGSCRKALEYGCQYVWLDTCCIDKSSSAELSEAINSMYEWYRAAAVCIVYLHDCHYQAQFAEIDHCEWFTRGWTLQELIAPRDVAFFDSAWRYIGKKVDMCKTLARITQIDIDVLLGRDPTEFSIAQRFSWAANRRTTKPEDRAYCLLGLFEVSLSMTYGEGGRAFLRLQEEIMRHSNDQTIFGWRSSFPRQGHSGLLAYSPACFAGCRDLVEATDRSIYVTDKWRAGPTGSMSNTIPGGFQTTNVGISITLATLPYAMNTYLAILKCAPQREQNVRVGILVKKMETSGQFRRICLNNTTVVSIAMDDYISSRALRARPLLIRQASNDKFMEANHGFWIRNLELPGWRSSELRRAKIFSRDGTIERCDDKSIALIPDGLHGTACVIRIPSQGNDRPWWRVEYLVLGFDTEFRPCFMIGNYKLGRDRHRFVRRVCLDDYSDTEPEHEFSNSWIHSKELPTELSRTDFRRDDFGAMRAPERSSRWVRIGFLNIKISFELTYPPRELEYLRPAPCTVWAVDVQIIDGMSPQDQANREKVKQGTDYVTKAVKNDLPKGMRQVFLGTLGVEALGLDELVSGLDF